MDRSQTNSQSLYKKKLRTLKKNLKLFFVPAFLISCSTYKTEIAATKSLVKQGQISEAIEVMKPNALKEDRDQLVHTLEYATLLQIAGRYKESNDFFLKADDLAEKVDYYSVTKIAASIVTSEEALQYKGEAYEKILINCMMAFNFLMLGETDNAIVQARRMNDKINLIRVNARPDYELNPFAFYLSGILFEIEKDFDNSYISYAKAFEIDPSNPMIKSDLIRVSKKSNRIDEYKKWKALFQDVADDPDFYNKKKGSLLVFFLQGWGPERDFSQFDRRFPKLYPSTSLTSHSQVYVNQAAQTPISQNVYDVQQASIQSFDADYSWMVTRKIGAMVGKEIIADQVRQKNEGLGLLLWIAMFVSDRADLRQWSTLPQSIHLNRFYLDPGTYKVKSQGMDRAGQQTSEQMPEMDVEIKSGKTNFLFWRSLK